MTPVSSEEFGAEYERLVTEYAELENVRCFNVTDCEACVDAVFCEDCVRCFRACYSVGCRDASDITHCKNCVRCYASTFCEDSERCAHSSFLIRCTDCIGCEYCIGCVGLRDKDFHILNRPYSRKLYFQFVKQLQAATTTA